MKSIGIDFKNDIICVMTDGQQGTEHGCGTLDDRSKFERFIPKGYKDRTSYTWNFETETVSVNQNFKLMPGAIMSKDDFIPEVILPMPGLAKRWKEFYSLLGFEEIETKDIHILPDALKKLLGLD
jgi:hypothetical protein